MAQYLIIIARAQPGLCDYLTRAFSGDNKVQIILDRRWGNWQRAEVHPQGRAPADRRCRRDVDSRLQITGFAIARQQERTLQSDWPSLPARMSSAHSEITS